MSLATTQFFTLLYILIATDTAAGFFGALKLWKIRHRFGMARWMGWLLASYVFWQFFQIVGAIYSPLHGVNITTGYAFWTLVGRVPLTVSLWSFTIHMYTRGD